MGNLGSKVIVRSKKGYLLEYLECEEERTDTKAVKFSSLSEQYIKAEKKIVSTHKQNPCDSHLHEVQANPTLESHKKSSNNPSTDTHEISPVSLDEACSQDVADLL